MNFLKFLGLAAIALSLNLGLTNNALAFSVCGLEKPQATFKTPKRLISICRGEASFQMIMTYYDGTGYQRIPVQKEGQKYRGSDDKHNYIIDSQQLIIGTDGEPPQRERVIQSR